MVKILNESLEAVMDWMRGGQLKFNPNKSELIREGDSIDWLVGGKNACSRWNCNLIEGSHLVLLNPDLHMEAPRLGKSFISFRSFSSSIYY